MSKRNPEDTISTIEIELVERMWKDSENRVQKSITFDTDALILDEHILPTIEEALKGFGFKMDGKRLAIVENDIDEQI